jgi:hypothetical protein
VFATLVLEGAHIHSTARLNQMVGARPRQTRLARDARIARIARMYKSRISFRYRSDINLELSPGTQWFRNPSQVVMYLPAAFSTSIEYYCQVRPDRPRRRADMCTVFVASLGPTSNPAKQQRYLNEHQSNHSSSTAGIVIITSNTDTTSSTSPKHRQRDISPSSSTKH